jgi:formylglycine-generating enzyme
VTFARSAPLWLALPLLLAAGCDACEKEKVVVVPEAAPPPPPPPPDPPCPLDMALVTYQKRQVCVDRYEAALEGWPASHAVDALDASTLRAIPAKGIKPQVNVSMYQADAACHNAGKRLCSGVEWTAACRGAKNNVYPYGSDYRKGACNEGRPSPMHVVFGPFGWGRHDDPRLAEADNTIEPGGSFPLCVSTYGNYDMHGNVHEWISDAAKPGDWRYGVFVGGYFADAQGNGFGCFYRTTAHIREYHDYSIGFRCCKEPKAALEIEL